jgi:hypothetical protein
MVAYKGDSVRLAGLFLNADTAATLNNLDSALNQAGYDRSRDRIIGYEGLPGLLYALDLKTYGTAFYFHEGGDNCIYLPVQSDHAIGSIWFLTFEPVNPQTRHCLSLRIAGLDKPAALKMPVGKVNHRWGLRLLYLEGPFSLGTTPLPAPPRP